MTTEFFNNDDQKYQMGSPNFYIIILLTVSNNQFLNYDFFYILDDKCRGWWRLSDIEDVNQLEATLNSRGTREQHLLTLVKRNFELLQDAAKK